MSYELISELAFEMHDIIEAESCICQHLSTQCAFCIAQEALVEAQRVLDEAVEAIEHVREAESDHCG